MVQDLWGPKIKLLLIPITLDSKQFSNEELILVKDQIKYGL